MRIDENGFRDPNILAASEDYFWWPRLRPLDWTETSRSIGATLDHSDSELAVHTVCIGHADSTGHRSRALNRTPELSAAHILAAWHYNKHFVPMEDHISPLRAVYHHKPTDSRWWVGLGLALWVSFATT